MRCEKQTAQRNPFWIGLVWRGVVTRPPKAYGPHSYHSHPFWILPLDPWDDTPSPKKNVFVTLQDKSVISCTVTVSL